MAPKPHFALLIVEDDPLFARTLRLQLGQGPFTLTFCAHTAPALRHLQAAKPDLILLDIHLGGHEEGLAALPKIIAAAPEVPVVVHSVLSDHATVVRAMRQGAHDYIPKHVGIKTLGEQLAAIISRHRAGAASLPPGPVGEHRPMLGQSPAMQALHKEIAQAKRSQGSVIILGEPGSGKELVARALQAREGPFVAVDASTLDGTLATGVLFGHERGAFTGAEVARAGLFEQAHGGIMYFDEIANMSLDVQAKLLRVLQEREITRLGGTQRRPLTFRLICATHADLPALCRAGRFRYDLLTRLQVFVLAVPPLRQRLADLPLLFDTFVARFCAENKAPPLPVAQATHAALRAYGWPGNVRELEHAAQYAVAACAQAEVAPEHLPPHVRLGAAATSPMAAVAQPVLDPRLGAALAKPLADLDPLASATAESLETDGVSFAEQVRAFERRTLTRAYTLSGGNISRMARRLGMDRSSLYAKLRLYAIHTSRSG
jgi:DNA-binding NtrC family response regulator